MVNSAPTVAIAEDDAFAAAELSEALRRLQLNVVGVADTAQGMVEVCRVHRPRLALMDIALAGDRDGIWTAETIRDAYGVASVFVTGLPQEQVLQRACAAQPAGYLDKPWTEASLRAAVTLALARVAQAVPLRTHAERVATALHEAAVGVMVVEQSGTISYANRHVNELFGAASMMGETVDGFVDNELAHKHAALRDCYSKHGKPMPMTARVVMARQRDGTVRPLRIALCPCDGERTLAVVVDASAEADANARMQSALAAAERLATSKAAFAAAVTHELRTPLQAVSGLVELLSDGESLESTTNIVEPLKQAVGTLRSLIDGVLDMSQLARGHVTLREDTVRLGEWLAELIDRLRSLVGSKDLELQHNVDLGLPDAVVVDRMRLEQVMTNLVGNAIKFTQAGTVTITARRLGPTIQFRVSDTGPGISPNAQRRVFEPFSRGDSSTADASPGAGLGLALARDLVVLMGGTMGLKSRLGEGSTFSFTLPLREGKLPRKVPAEVRHAHPLSGLRLLVIEDEPLTRRVLEAMLRSMGADVVTAADGCAALHASESGTFDAVLLDLQLPDMRGEQVCATMRSRGLALPIVACTGVELGDELLLGFSSQLKKPFSRDALARALGRSDD